MLKKVVLLLIVGVVIVATTAAGVYFYMEKRQVDIEPVVTTEAVQNTVSAAVVLLSIEDMSDEELGKIIDFAEEKMDQRDWEQSAVDAKDRLAALPQDELTEYVSGEMVYAFDYIWDCIANEERLSDPVAGVEICDSYKEWNDDLEYDEEAEGVWPDLTDFGFQLGGCDFMIDRSLVGGLDRDVYTHKPAVRFCATATTGDVMVCDAANLCQVYAPDQLEQALAKTVPDACVATADYLIEQEQFWHYEFMDDIVDLMQLDDPLIASHEEACIYELTRSDKLDNYASARRIGQQHLPLEKVQQMIESVQKLQVFISVKNTNNIVSAFNIAKNCLTAGDAVSEPVANELVCGGRLKWPPIELSDQSWSGCEFIAKNETQPVVQFCVTTSDNIVIRCSTEDGDKCEVIEGY